MGCVARIIVAMYDPNPSTQRSETLDYALSFIALGAAFLAAECLKLGYFGTAGEMMTEYLRKTSFAAVLRQEMGWFDEEDNNSAVLTTRLQNDVAQIHNIVTLVTPSLLRLLLCGDD